MPVVSDESTSSNSEKLDEKSENIIQVQSSSSISSKDDHQQTSSHSSSASASTSIERTREVEREEEKPSVSADYEKLPRGSIYEKLEKGNSNSKPKSKQKKTIKVQKKPIPMSITTSEFSPYEKSTGELIINHPVENSQSSPRLIIRKNEKDGENFGQHQNPNQNPTHNQNPPGSKGQVNKRQEMLSCRRIIMWKISQLRNQLDEIQEMTTSADAVPEFRHWNFPSTFREIKHNVEFLQEETTRLKSIIGEIQSEMKFEDRLKIELEYLCSQSKKLDANSDSDSTFTSTFTFTPTEKNGPSLNCTGEKSGEKSTATEISTASALTASASASAVELMDSKFKSWSSLYKITLFIFDSNLSTFANSTKIDFTPYDKIHFNFTNSFSSSHIKLLRKFLQQRQIHKLNLYFIFNLKTVENIPSLFIFLQTVATFSSKIKIVSLDLENVEESSIAQDLSPPWRNLSCPGLVHLTSLTISSLETDAHIQWLCGFLNGAEKFNELSIGKPASFPTGVFQDFSDENVGSRNSGASSTSGSGSGLKRKRGKSVTTLRQLATLSESANLRKASVSIFNLDLFSSLSAGNSASEDLNHLRMKYKSSLLNLQNLELSCEVNVENWSVFTRLLQTFHVTLRGITGLKIHPDIEFSRRYSKFSLFSVPLVGLGCFSTDNNLLKTNTTLPMPSLSSLSHLEIECSAKWLFENLHHFPHLKKLFWRRIDHKNHDDLNSRNLTIEAISNCKLILRKLVLLWIVEPVKSSENDKENELNEKILKRFSSCFPFLKQLILGVNQCNDGIIFWLQHEKNFPKLSDLFITKFVQVTATGASFASVLTKGEARNTSRSRYDLKRTKEEIHKIQRDDLNQINVGVFLEFPTSNQNAGVKIAHETVDVMSNLIEEFSQVASQCDSLKTIFIPWIGKEMTRRIAEALACQKSKWTKSQGQSQIQHVQVLIPSKPEISSTGNSDSESKPDSNLNSNELAEDLISNEILSELSVKNGFDLDVRRVEASRMMTTPGFIIGKMDKRFWSRF